MLNALLMIVSASLIVLSLLCPPLTELLETTQSYFIIKKGKKVSIDKSSEYQRIKKEAEELYGWPKESDFMDQAFEALMEKIKKYGKSIYLPFIISLKN